MLYSKKFDKSEQYKKVKYFGYLKANIACLIENLILNNIFIKLMF
jgi:hypothetical protein